jgi:peptide/nickel transport system substrate-binding protein
VKRLPASLGPAYEDVRGIRAIDEREIEIVLRRPSTFVFEGLETVIFKGEDQIGTGPYYVVNQSDTQVELKGNERYDLGRPPIDRILFKSYGSVRAAWADMLRGEADMLYEIGLDAMDSMQPSTQTRVFTVDRPYQYAILLNVRRPSLKDATFRRALNAAIDRQALVDQILGGHGSPAYSPIWPKHWAYDPQVSAFKYEPSPVRATGKRIRITCMVDASTERVALFVQRQLQAIGVDLELQAMTLKQAVARFEKNDWDAFLVDAAQGPTLIRSYWWWRTGGPFNWGGFSTSEVDRALDRIRDTPQSDEQAFKRAVAEYQKALVADPPAIFLAWSQRARAVSTRFVIPDEPGADIISSLRMWRPAGVRQSASRN